MARVADRAREAVARGALAGARAVAGRLGQHVTPANIYSAIPTLPPPTDAIWSHRQELAIDLDAQLDFVRRELGPYLAELPEALQPARDRHGFDDWNGMYQTADAEFLYALVRHLKPARVVEVGSGSSTLVSAAAAVRNGRDGAPLTLTAIDPFPRRELSEAMEGIAEIERRDANDVPLERFAELEAGDVLFVDSSHVVKLGSEVNRLVLEVLPRLAPGVWVHFHDLFLPYEYPRHALEGWGFFNEQYLVQAFLTGNADWEVRLAHYALWRDRREELLRLVPSVGRAPQADYAPTAFWLRRRD